MRQLFYVSTAAPGVGSAEVDDILRTSQENNPPRGITGFLLFNGRNFLQLIEGPDEAVQRLRGVLDQDPRHDGVTWLDNSPLAGRNFAGWAMQRLWLADSVDQRRAELEPLLPATLDPLVRRTVLNFASLN